MISNTPTIPVRSTLTGESIKLSIDPGSMQHIMRVLTNLYEDPEMAVLREYSTNALDAQIEAGYVGPVEVELPSSWSQQLTITDHGIGLSLDDIRYIYSQYGTSTKTDTNEQTGMLGLGCKSGLAYTSQFFVVSVKDGMKIHVAVAIDGDGVGGITIVEESYTKEPNGTKIVIPTKRYGAFVEKAAHLFSFWPSGSVLVNGEPNVHISEQEGVKELSKNVYMVNKYGFRNNYVVMGNVPYAVGSDLSETLNMQSSFKVVAFVEMGAVNFVPSRESLHMTDRTKLVLEEIQKSVIDSLIASIQTDIDKAESKHGAIRVMSEWRARFYPISPCLVSTYSYRGEPIPEDIVFTEGVTVDALRLKSYGTRYIVKSIKLDTKVARTLFIQNYTPTTISSNKKRIAEYAENHSMSFPFDRMVVSAGSFETNSWIDPKQIVDWETIKRETKVVKVKAEKGYFEGYTLGRYQSKIDLDDLDDDYQIIHYDRFNEGLITDRNYDYAFAVLDPGTHVFVKVGQNRIAKFMRDFPEAKDLTGAITEAFETWKATISDNELFAMGFQESYGIRALRALDQNKIDDPALKRLVSLAKLDISQHNQKRQLFGRVLKWLDIEIEGDQESYLLVNYPLCNLDRLQSHREHVYWYLNTVYANTTTKEI